MEAVRKVAMSELHQPGPGSASTSGLRPLNALTLSKKADIPLAVASEWLFEEEKAGHLARDRDGAGNVWFYSNLFFKT